VAVSGAMDEINRLAPDVPQLVRVTVRLLAALFIGTAIGLQRELTHKPAGLRTHMLVALGTALFLVSAAEAGMAVDTLSRIVQGLATGIGFLGGGAILKLTDEREIHGLTTAAGIWMTAAASAAAGLGQITVALIGTVVIAPARTWRITRRTAIPIRKTSRDGPTASRDGKAASQAESRRGRVADSP
jgi:putative Mg2+ transporter-C (MgtC) family protein